MTHLLTFFLGIVFTLCVGYDIKRKHEQKNQTMRKKYENKYGKDIRTVFKSTKE